MIRLAVVCTNWWSWQANSSTPGKLLLQTEGAQRVYSDSNAAATQGAGSRLLFQNASGEEVSGTDQTLASQYLKVIRVAFVLNFGNANGAGSERVLAYAKADINTGYLTLCDYNGEPLDTGNVILSSMLKNQAYQISVVVWLDGNAVTNANMAINNDVLSKATLNLQFATDVELVPASNANLHDNPPTPEQTPAEQGGNEGGNEGGEPNGGEPNGGDQGGEPNGGNEGGGQGGDQGGDQGNP